VACSAGGVTSFPAPNADCPIKETSVSTRAAMLFRMSPSRGRYLGADKLNKPLIAGRGKSRSDNRDRVGRPYRLGLQPAKRWCTLSWRAEAAAHTIHRREANPSNRTPGRVADRTLWKIGGGSCGGAGSASVPRHLAGLVAPWSNGWIPSKPLHLKAPILVNGIQLCV
jgi:hypothetical protein